MAVCCPLTSHDSSDGPECSYTTTPRARKEHTCCECRETIAPGSKYEKTTGIWDGHPETYKTCLSCAEIRDHFTCGRDDLDDEREDSAPTFRDPYESVGGFYYERLWDDLEEHLFPDMTAGGPCLQGLSPSNIARLFERRLRWLDRRASSTQIHMLKWAPAPDRKDA